MNNIYLHHDLPGPAHWIGVDLNTTGYAVVAADPVTGGILKLGKRISYAPTASTKKCTKLYKEGKLWKLKKQKTRERKAFKAMLSKISRKIVSFAEMSCAGIKFEKLFTYRDQHAKEAVNPYEFSFDNGSFVSLLHLVEKRALSRGIPVLYINPTNTSKRCSRCGHFGHRFRKRFECPHCGAVFHADVNAAFNIAVTPTSKDRFELDWMRMIHKKIRRTVKTKVIEEESFVDVTVPNLCCQREIFVNQETRPMVQGEG